MVGQEDSAGSLQGRRPDEKPPSGRLIPLRTVLEVRSGNEQTDVYVTRVPLKAASNTLNSLRSFVADGSGEALQHLRKFAKYAELPAHVQDKFKASEEGDSLEDTRDIFLFVCPVTSTNPEELKEFLTSNLATDHPTIVTTSVPSLAPTSAEQAAAWTQNLWPTVYRKTNPFGPHPSITARAEGEMSSDAADWLALAHRAACEAHAAGIGEAVGAVIVDRTGDSKSGSEDFRSAAGPAAVLAVASDGRWMATAGDGPPCPQASRSGKGNVMAHAVLRAVGMVAAQLCLVNEEREDNKDDAETPTSAAPPPRTPPPLYPATPGDLFLDDPVLPTERAAWDAAQAGPGGYLCSGLELYLTHEPCVMCSMAILHSRFARVVFQRRMPRTGGLSSEVQTRDDDDAVSGGLGLGLCWRKELNWSLLGWEWQPDGSTTEEHVCDGVEATVHV